MPLAYIQEVIKYTSVESIDVIGSLNDDMLNQVIDKMPQLMIVVVLIVLTNSVWAILIL